MAVYKDEGDYGDEQQPEREGDGEQKPAPLEYDIEADNLVFELEGNDRGEQFLKELADKVIRDFDECRDGTEQYRERFGADWKLFTGDLPPKQYPWENCANPNVPIMLENLSRLTFRAYGEMFGDWSNVIAVAPIGPDDKLRSEVLSKHGNWQFRSEIPDFKRQQARGILLFFTAGDVTCHSTRDLINQRNQHDILTCDQFYIPYTYVTTSPDYSDVPFKIRVYEYQRHDLNRMRDVWANVERVIEQKPESWDGEDRRSPLREGVAMVSGEEVPDDLRNAPYQLLWYEGWCKLPNQKREHHIKCVVDKRSRAILHLQLHEIENWKDRIRFERQKAEIDAYAQALLTFESPEFRMAQQREMELRQRLSEPDIDPNERAAVEQALAEQPLPTAPPPPPDWLDDPEGFVIAVKAQQGGPEDWIEPVRMDPIQMFAHGVCIEPLVGSLGLSYGRILSDFQRAANVALSQFADAAHLANSWSIITPGIDFDGGFEISPGRINKAIGHTGQELRNSIVELKPGAANPQLLDVVSLMYQYGQTAVQAPNVLSGEPGKSGETYRGLASRIEQATKQLGVATRNYANFFEQIAKNNAKLNEMYMPDEELIYLNDHMLGTFDELRIGRAMYQRDYRVEIRADLRFTTESQRVAEADEVLAMVGAIQPLQNNPAFVYVALKNALEARNQADLVQALGAAPPAPEQAASWLTPPPVMPQGMPGAPPGPAAPPGVGQPSGTGGPVPGTPPPNPAAA